MFIQIHAIHSVPPSCLNRDDTGAVKGALYGGVRRHRVSSQSWKRAMRGYASANGLSEIGVRTRTIPDLIADLIAGDDERADKVRAASKVATAAGFPVKTVGKGDQERHRTDMAFISPSELDVLARIAQDVLGGSKVPPKKELNAALAEVSVTPDIALFGRMVASERGLSVDATAQVAHAISTHESHSEMDFYTAVDDVATDEEGGSGFIGNQEFTSSTLLRYASVDVDRLREIVGEGVVRDALVMFVESFVRSMPTGKSNSYANTTLPDYVMVEVTDAPVSYVGAFEDPVRSRGDIVGASIEKLESYRSRLGRIYGLSPERIVVDTHSEDSATLADLTQWVREV